MDIVNVRQMVLSLHQMKIRNASALTSTCRRTWTAWEWPGCALQWSQPHLSFHMFPGTTPPLPKESCIPTPSAFFWVLGQWKWITGLAGISPKVGTQPFWSTDGVRSGFSLQTGEAMWFSYNLERFLTEWRLIRCLEFPRNNVDSVSSLHTTRTHS